jgi:ribonuclease HI
VEAEIECFHGDALGHWRFDLQSTDGKFQFSASDWEPNIGLQRLELLTAIRGLEELDQPSSVTIVTDSDYLHHGFDFGLREWRQNHWTWERFGEFVPISNDDLWRRLDRSSEPHRVQCRRSCLVSNDSRRTLSTPIIPSEQRRQSPGRFQRWIRQLSRVASSVVPV